jgi:hypothetical protein
MRRLPQESSQLVEACMVSIYIYIYSLVTGERMLKWGYSRDVNLYLFSAKVV